MKHRAVAATALLLAGCAYYNGLYNANRLAREAERAERDGRTGEARSLWSQAAVKAESVVSRHPKSRYRDDALYLQGRAFERVGSCSQALHPLSLAADSSPDPSLRVDARLLLADCRLQLREPESTLVAVAPVLDEGGPEARSAALLLRGRALLVLGRNEAALEELTASGAREGAYAKAIALARLNRHDDAAATLAAVVDAPYQEAQWLPTLDSVGAGNPAVVGPVLARLADHPDVRDGERARLWLADAERWLARGDTTAAESRFQAVRALVADSGEGRAARARLATFAARAVSHWSEVGRVADSLRVAVRDGGAAARIGGRYSAVFARVSDALDLGDLALFVAAEDVRDTVRNPALAGSLMEQVVERYPESAIAPKALLALAALRPDVADSLAGLLQTRYPASPYTLVLAGTGATAYEALEDSLRQAAEALRRAANADRRRDDPARRARNDP